MQIYKRAFIIGNLILVLLIFNLSIFKKESLLKEGQLILLELAPVDPRSLMQGDFMRLRYGISSDIVLDSIPPSGFCVVQLQENGVAKKVRIQATQSPLSDAEYLIEYTAKGRRGINIGAESFFFQEGQGEKYEKAKYGGIKVDPQGNSLLIGLYDEDLNIIE